MPFQILIVKFKRYILIWLVILWCLWICLCHLMKYFILQ